LEATGGVGFTWLPIVRSTLEKLKRRRNDVCRQGGGREVAENKGRGGLGTAGGEGMLKNASLAWDVDGMEAGDSLRVRILRAGDKWQLWEKSQGH